MITTEEVLRNFESKISSYFEDIDALSTEQLGYFYSSIEIDIKVVSSNAVNVGQAEIKAFIPSTNDLSTGIDISYCHYDIDVQKISGVSDVFIKAKDLLQEKIINIAHQRDESEQFTFHVIIGS